MLQLDIKHLPVIFMILYENRNTEKDILNIIIRSCQLILGTHLTLLFENFLNSLNHFLSSLIFKLLFVTNFVKKLHSLKIFQLINNFCVKMNYYDCVLCSLGYYVFNVRRRTIETLIKVSCFVAFCQLYNNNYSSIVSILLSRSMRSVLKVVHYVNDI